MNPISYEEYQRKVQNLKTADDLVGFAREILAPASGEILNKDQFQVEQIDDEPKKLKGRRSWRILGDSRQIVAQDAEPTRALAIREPEGTKTKVDDLDEKIINLYAKGLTTRDIHNYIKEIYGIEIAQPMISAITDKVLPLMREWQARPLSSLYAIIYLDGIFFKVREEGRIVNKCAYIILGINDQGHKEVLGILIKESEGAKFWMQILTEIKNRGVNDILIACIDGLKGFSEAIKTIYPDTQIQQCIFHQILHTVKYTNHKHRKEFCSDLREVYTAPTEEAGLEALDQVKSKWPQYSFYLKSWEQKWNELASFFEYPEPIRRIIYTANAIELLNRQFRKVTKTTVMFPHEDALRKLLWLAQEDIAGKWNLPVRNWGEIISQLTILFPDRVQL